MSTSPEQFKQECDDLSTALSMVTAAIDPKKQMTAIDVMNMDGDQHSPEYIVRIINALVGINVIQLNNHVKTLVERNRLAPDPQPEPTQQLLLGAIGKSISQLRIQGHT